MQPKARRGLALLRYQTTPGHALAGLLVLLALAAALAAALRPGDDGAARSFARDYAAATQAQATDAAALGARVEYAARRGPDRLAELYRDLRISTDATRAALARLDAPADLRAELARLTALLDAQSAALERLVAATTSQDRRALAGATRELARTAAETSSLRSRIERSLAGATT